MFRKFFVLVLTIFIAPFGVAQTAKKSTKIVHTRPNTKAPTKVTGDGDKTDSGLQYWDIVVGTGKVGKEGDGVRVHYTGWLPNGKKFDSSVDAGQPIHIRARQRRSDQRLGRRRGGNESRRQAPAAHPPRSRLRRKWHATAPSHRIPP